MIDKFRVGIIRADGTPEAKNFPDKKPAEDWILSFMEKEHLRQARLKDLETNIEERII